MRPPVDSRPPARARLAGRGALALISGALYVAALPPIGESGLALLALAPLVLAVRGTSRPLAYFLGWLAGTAAATPLVSPSVAQAGIAYFELSLPWAIVSGLLAAQLYAAIWFGVFGLLAREIQARHPPGALATAGIAAAWVVCDFGRATAGDGVPFILLAHSQAAEPLLLQVADLAGVPGVGFVLAFVGGALAQAWVASRDRRALARLAVATAIVLGGALLYGRVELARWSARGGRTLRVAVVQGALPNDWRGSLRHLPEAIARMAELTQSVVRDAPDLIVWPENAVSVSVAANPETFAAIADSLPPQSRLLVGAPRAVEVAPGRAQLRNSAYLIAPGNRIDGVYDKVRLTAWAEAPGWPAALTARLRPSRSSDYTAGEDSTLLSVASTPFGVLICSEALYASLARDEAKAGARFLVNISNDGWFGGRWAREQHFAAVIFRAVETRRFLVRSTSDGVSAIVDPSGAVVARAPNDEPATLVADVEPVEFQTVYTRIGDLFAWSCVALSLLLSVFPRYVSRSADLPAGSTREIRHPSNS